MSISTITFLESLKHERRIFSADKMILIVSLMLLMTLGYALADGFSWVSRQQAMIDAARVEEHGRLLENRKHLIDMSSGKFKPANDMVNPSNPLWVGNRLAVTHVVLLPGALAATSIGQSDLFPPFLTVSADSKETYAFGEEIENPVNLLTGHFDLAFVIIFLLPLMIIALSYSAISVEREQGTLALCMANPVKLATLLFAKLSFRFLLILILTIGISVAGLSVHGVALGSIDAVARLISWMLLVAAYSFFWFAVAAAINVLGKHSAQNALILAAIWVVFLLVIPTFCSIAANIVYPLPSRAAMINTLRDVQTGVHKEFDATQARYQQEHPLDSGVASPEIARLRALILQEAASKASRVMAEHDDQQMMQQALISRLRFLSPAILMQQALNDVAGTGEGCYRHFNAQVDRFSRSWVNFFLPKVLNGESLTISDYDKFPRFQYTDEDTSEWIRKVFAALIGLLIPGGLLGAFVIRRIDQYPIN